MSIHACVLASEIVLFSAIHTFFFFKKSTLSYPNLVWGLSLIDLLILASRLTVLNQLQCETDDHLVFWLRMRKIPKKGDKRVFSLVFLDPSSPRLASGSPGLPNNFMVKKPTRLGELIPSALSFSLPGRAATTQSDPLPINRRRRGVLRGSES